MNSGPNNHQKPYKDEIDFEDEIKRVESGLNKKMNVILKDRDELMKLGDEIWQDNNRWAGDWWLKYNKFVDDKDSVGADFFEKDMVDSLLQMKTRNKFTTLKPNTTDVNSLNYKLKKIDDSIVKVTESGKNWPDELRK